MRPPAPWAAPSGVSRTPSTPATARWPCATWPWRCPRCRRPSGSAWCGSASATSAPPSATPSPPPASTRGRCAVASPWRVGSTWRRPRASAGASSCSPPTSGSGSWCRRSWASIAAPSTSSSARPTIRGSTASSATCASGSATASSPSGEPPGRCWRPSAEAAGSACSSISGCRRGRGSPSPSSAARRSPARSSPASPCVPAPPSSR